MNLAFIKFIFIFLVSTTVLHLIIAGVARVKTAHKEFNYLIFYWISLFVTFIAAALLTKNPTQIALSYFTHFMPVFMISKILRTSIGMSFNWKRYLAVQGIGMLASSVLLSTEAGFTISLIPVTITTTMPLWTPMYSVLVSDRKKANWVEKGMGLLFFVGIIHHFNFAFFRLEPSAAILGWSMSIAQYQCLSVLLPLIINLKRDDKERRNIQHALEKMSGNHQEYTDEIDELYRILEYQISQKDELFQKLQVSNTSLEEEREINDILIKTVSHDLANPLTVINAYMEMLRSKKIPAAEEERTWDRMKNGVESALSMINRIRQAILTRTQAEFVVIQPVDLDRVFRGAEELFETRLREKNVRLVIDNQVPPEIRVNGDEKALREHIMANIISNAIKYSHENSEIHISAMEEGRSVRVEVKDFGVGIANTKAAAKKHMGSTPGTNGEVGTGFGLMVLGYFARKFGATVNIYSRPSNDHGTSVVLHFNKSALSDVFPDTHVPAPELPGEASLYN